MGNDYRYARDMVSYFSRKYGVRTRWLWDILEDNFNFDRGDGHIMDKDEIEYFQSIVEDCLCN